MKNQRKIFLLLFLIPTFGTIAIISIAALIWITSYGYLVERIGPFELTTEARQIDSLLESNEAVLPPSKWPPGFRKLKPIQIRRLMSGIFAITSQTGRAESGIYVSLSKDMDEPQEGSGLSFSQIQSNIYWCRQKIRHATAP